MMGTLFNNKITRCNKPVCLNTIEMTAIIEAITAAVAAVAAIYSVIFVGG
jgi:hypothetical protein